MPPTLTKSEHLDVQLKRELASPGRTRGERFYSIPEVSERFQVSTATAYKVVAGLVREGYLRSHRGKGYFVDRKPAMLSKHAVAGDGETAGVTGRTLLLVNDFEYSSPSPKVLAGIQQACGEEDYRFEVVSASAMNLVRVAGRDDVAGLLLTHDREHSPVGWIRKPKICIGHWASPDDGVISYIADAEDAAVQVVRHLCGLGHTRIGFLVGRADNFLTQAFCGHATAGFRRGFQLYGLSPDDLVSYVDLEKSEAATVNEFVADFRRRGVTAVFVPAWSAILKLINRMGEEKLSIPADLSVIAYGDDPLTRHIEPAMTSFDLFIQDIARQASLRLINHDRSGAPLPRARFVTSVAELVIRQSTAMKASNS